MELAVQGVTSNVAAPVYHYSLEVHQHFHYHVNSDLEATRDIFPQNKIQYAGCESKENTSEIKLNPSNCCKLSGRLLQNWSSSSDLFYHSDSL